MVLFAILSESAKDIALISITVAFVSAMVTKVFLSEEGKAARERTKEIQKEMKKAQKKGDAKKMQKLQGEMISTMMDSFRHNLRPMAITFIPFILVYIWLYDTYGFGELDYFGLIHIVGHGAELPMATVFGFNLYWLGWYILCIMLISIPLNKLLKNY